MEETDQHKLRRIPVPNAEQRRREAIRDTVKRGARGNLQLSLGKFVTPKDKSFDKARSSPWKGSGG